VLIKKSILISKGTGRVKRLVNFALEGSLFLVTSISLVAIIFMVLFIARDALPFFELRGIKEFFTSIRWYPTGSPAEFGTLAIIFGSIMVTFLATVMAVPVAIFAAISLSDILPFSVRQVVKPIIEIIAAIPSVAYGFFALVIFAPLLQQSGGHLLGVAVWMIGLPVSLLLTYVISGGLTEKVFKNPSRFNRITIFIILESIIIFALYRLYAILRRLSENSILKSSSRQLYC
jgi:phosphate transport system permease protein